MAELICLSCQYFISREKIPSRELSSRWNGICGHKDLEEANLIDTVLNCQRYLRVVYSTRFERLLKDQP